MSILRLCLAILFTLFLAACGGGGGGGGGGDGGLLKVTVSYSGTAYLFRPSVITPTFSGFQGHTPACSLASGILPQGMTLNSNCTITGTPAQFGNFQVEVRVSASGVSNTVNATASFAVLGPSVFYNFASSYIVGDALSVAPSNNMFWTPVAGETVTYALESGQLPPGLTIDAATGRVYGAITAAGNYSFKLRASVTSGGVTATNTPQIESAFSATLPQISYNGSGVAWTSQPYSASPTLPINGATYQFALSNHNGFNNVLPAGLSLNPVTGEISGTPTQVDIPQQFYGISVTVNSNGAQYTLNTFVQLRVNSPVYIIYSTAPWGIVGQPYSATPTIYVNSPTPLSQPVYQFAATSLPVGLSINPGTGVISGTPTTSTGQTGQPTVTVTITHNGITFNQTVTNAIIIQ